MGTNSKIEWTDHTFNPWMGCTKVSPGCKHCYAETLMDKRWGKVQWGPQGERVRTSKELWKKPLAWNKETWRECLKCGFRGKVGPDEPYYLCRCGSRETKPIRQRVFCASLADVFEDNPQLNEWRVELFALIDATPNLDWQILTKRPEKIFSLGTDAVGELFDIWLVRHPNVWMGTSVEDQKTANERIPELLNCLASVLFLSVEPLLGPIDLVSSIALDIYDGEWADLMLYSAKFETFKREIDWVIVGGESGPDARPMNPDWVTQIRTICQDADVPFFFKQWGEWAPLKELDIAAGTTFKHKPVRMGDDVMCQVGKHAAGRLLAGRIWDGFPSTDSFTDSRIGTDEEQEPKEGD